MSKKKFSTLWNFDEGIHIFKYIYLSFSTMRAPPDLSTSQQHHPHWQEEKQYPTYYGKPCFYVVAGNISFIPYHTIQHHKINLIITFFNTFYDGTGPSNKSNTNIPMHNAMQLLLSLSLSSNPAEFWRLDCFCRFEFSKSPPLFECHHFSNTFQT